MTKITIFRNQDQAFLGFDCLGHAGYAEEGGDIVCAGSSALVINTNQFPWCLHEEKFSTDSDRRDRNDRHSGLMLRQVHEC